MDDERVRQRIVLALDELPVPPATALRLERRQRIGGLTLGPEAAAAAIALFLVAALIAIPVGQTLFGGGRALRADEFRDGFSGITIDRGRWEYFAVGSGPTIAATNGRIEVTIPATTQADPGHTISDGHLVTRCEAHGDFDARMDYALVEWPANNGVYLQFGLKPPIRDGVFRTSPQEAYEASVEGAPGTRLPTTDTTGTFRLTRTGSTVTAYVLAGESWVQLASGASTTADVTFQINVNAEEGRFQHKTVRVALDNFGLSADRLICPGR